MDMILALVVLLIQGMMSTLLVWSFDAKKIGSTSSPPKSPVLNAQKEMRTYINVVLIMGALGGGAIFLSPLPTLAEMGIAIGGIIIGFVVALFRFNHWDDLMAHRLQEMIKANQSSPPKSRKLIFSLLILSFASHLLTSRVRDIVGADVTDGAFSAILIAACAVGSGYFLEHLTLYCLHHSDSQLPTPDDSL